uniref:Uncharacterized protein n=1 Tax=Cannabis sativa TaxID=3483 RepID=A0A803NFA3_CANSA
MKCWRLRWGWIDLGSRLGWIVLGSRRLGMNFTMKGREGTMPRWKYPKDCPPELAVASIEEVVGAAFSGSMDMLVEADFFLAVFLVFFETSRVESEVTSMGVVLFLLPRLAGTIRLRRGDFLNCPCMREKK